ncbi:MAG TPA: DUF202 domain-containing protein [Candidatus Binataceae bacterium]|nr:DUF202 domain-containing protein [Candidatus Binataceae bacterium]
MPQTSATPSDYLAAERTFLAWIRTGLALMGFGFVVARFGLFLREIAMTTNTHPLEPTGMSLWGGIALLLAGVAVNVAAAVHHTRLIRELNRGEHFGRPSALGIALALVLGAMGVILAAYLLLMR